MWSGRQAATLRDVHEKGLMMANIGKHTPSVLLSVGLGLAVLAGCSQSDRSDAGSAVAGPSVTESPVIGTVPATDPPNSTPDASEDDTDATFAGVVGQGPEDPVPFEYSGFREENWSITIGQVRVRKTGVDINSSDTHVMVLVETELAYVGDNGSGQLLDLVFELETPDGPVGAVRSPCTPQPENSLDLFASVATADSVEGVLCFDTDQLPSALLVTPLIDEPIRIEFSAP